jgi:hypothetical protein
VAAASTASVVIPRAARFIAGPRPDRHC